MNGKPNIIKEIASHFGGQSGLARALNTRQSTVWEWVHNERVPSSRIPDVIAAANALEPPVALDARDFFRVPAREAA